MLTIDNLIKTFPDENKAKDGDGKRRVHAIDDISITLGDGDFFTLLGPSGCGKTTTLRSVAGLEDPDEGRITVAGRTLFEAGKGKKVNVPANRRGLGMVFQSYAIWPHMSVFENAAFPLRVSGKHLSKQDLKARVMRVLETMELGHLANRRATKLSGGQQQRLALARAIVTEPPLLLLDEPLSNLDAKLRESLRFEIKRLQYELGITTLYVTHDQSEALAMSTNIAVMHAGRIAQLGTPREIYETPASTFVAEFIGASNLLAGAVTDVDAATVGVDTAIGAFRAKRVRDFEVGQAVRLSIRPEVLTVVEDASAGPGVNRIEGSVLTSSYVGDSVITVVRVGDSSVRVKSRSTYNPEVGGRVILVADGDDIGVLPEEL